MLSWDDLGEYLEVDLADEKEVKLDRFLRIRVEIEVNKLFIRSDKKKPKSKGSSLLHHHQHWLHHLSSPPLAKRTTKKNQVERYIQRQRTSNPILDFIKVELNVGFQV